VLVDEFRQLVGRGLLDQGAVIAGLFGRAAQILVRGIVRGRRRWERGAAGGARLQGRLGWFEGKIKEFFKQGVTFINRK